MTETLSKTVVSGLSIPGTYWDEEITGFGVRVLAPNARGEMRRSFFLNYRVNGRERRHTIGSFPTWSAMAARAEAKELRKRVDRGEDPAAEKRDARNAPTVNELAERYIRDHLATKADRTRQEDVLIINREILPALGPRQVAAVHLGDIEALHRSIGERPAPVRANRVIDVASRMFSLATRPLAGEDKPWRGPALGNPCKGIQRYPEHGRERFFSTRELAVLSDALVRYPSPPPANCIKFIMLTGCRPGEAVKATWEQVDAEPGYWSKPAANTKQRRVHRVPLNPAALELLADLRQKRDVERADGRDSKWLFPGRDRTKPLKQINACWSFMRDTGNVALWAAAEDGRVAKLVADLTQALGHPPSVKQCKIEAAHRKVPLPKALQGARIYDLRHTFASVGAGGGLSLPIIGRLLGHTQSRTTQRYAHLADDPLQEATDKISTVISNAGNSGNVVTFPKEAGR
jgi:integrase